MDNIIVSSSRGVTVLGGGEIRAGELEEALRRAPCLVAADGAAAHALDLNHQPEAVIGDMDSIPNAVRAAVPAGRFHEISDQESTDFDKVLRSIRAPLVLGVGFLGRRVDHQLANLSVLVRRSEVRCILIGKHDVILAAPPEIALDLAPASRVSLFPMTQVKGRSRGLHWPVDGLDMTPDGVIGTSNRVADNHTGPVELSFDAPGMLLILPREALAAAIDGLMRASAPARAI